MVDLMNHGVDPAGTDTASIEGPDQDQEVEDQDLVLGGHAQFLMEGGGDALVVIQEEIEEAGIIQDPSLVPEAEARAEGRGNAIKVSAGAEVVVAA